MGMGPGLRLKTYMDYTVSEIPCQNSVVVHQERLYLDVEPSLHVIASTEPTAVLIASNLSNRSHGRSMSSRPKWP